MAQRNPRTVISLPLIDGVSLSLVQEDDGCRFQAFHQEIDTLGIVVSVDDRKRRFPTQAGARDYFRQQYGPLLRADEGEPGAR
jgi:hypothetical protein